LVTYVVVVSAAGGVEAVADRGPDDCVSVTAAAHRLGVSTRTLRRYTAEGRLPDARSAGGQRICRVGDLDAITGKPCTGRAVGYAWVSSRRQLAAGDLCGGRSVKTKRFRVAAAAGTESGDAA
jgi:excisionase family DNA binding protein